DSSFSDTGSSADCAAVVQSGQQRANTRNTSTLPAMMRRCAGPPKPAIEYLQDSESERCLRRLGRPELHAFELEHALFRLRAAGCREAAELAAGGQHAMTWNDERHGVARHRLADIAGRLRSAAEFLRERAVRRRASPTDASQSGVCAAKEFVL